MQTREIEQLIIKKSDINAQNNFKETPLMNAASCGDVKSLQLLLSAKANVHLEDIDGETSLTKAVGFPECLAILITAKSHINHRTQNGQTPLIKAVAEGHTESIDLLIAAKANIHIQDNNDNTALAWSCHNTGTDAIQSLIIAGAIPHHRHEDHPKNLLSRLESEDLRNKKVSIAIAALCHQQRNVFKRENRHLQMNDIIQAENNLMRRKNFCNLHHRNITNSIDLSTESKIPCVLLNMITEYLSPLDILLTNLDKPCVVLDPKHINFFIEKEKKIEQQLKNKKRKSHALCELISKKLKLK